MTSRLPEEEVDDGGVGMEYNFPSVVLKRNASLGRARPFVYFGNIQNGAP
jgi:hypothetical protein